MSARRPRIDLAPTARNDLRDILQYTGERWGIEQRDAYRRVLFRGFERLANYPGLGRARPEYGPDIRSHRIEQHVAIYRATDAGIRIARILHARRDREDEIEETSG